MGPTFAAPGSLHGKAFTLKRAEGSLHGEGCLQDVQRALCTCAFRWPANLYTYIGPMVPGLSAEVPISIKGSLKHMSFFPWRARSGPFLRPLRQDSLVQLAWQFEGGKCPLTYLISCTVFLAPSTLQIANSRLDLKNLEDTVKLGVYSPTSLTGPRTTGAPAQEIHGNSISVTSVVHIFPPLPTKEATLPLPH